MQRQTRLATFALAAAVAGSAVAATAPKHISFVTCPIVQDTDTVPCWMADYQGKRYYLGIQQEQSSAFHPPWLSHQVLVEGVVSDEPSICGGTVLKPVKTSPLPEIDLNCNVMLPAEARYQVPFAVRGPGPNPRKFEGVRGPRAETPPPVAPFKPQTFTAYYDFDTEWATLSTRAMTEAMNYAKAINAKQVEVTGYRAVSKLSDGRDFAERPDMAKRRAERMGATLRDIGVPAQTIKVSWSEKALPGNGVDDDTRRKTTIVVKP
ncbi:MAG: hypothetical protein ABIO39_08715 [Caulobacteraceae bacterium]